MDHMSYFYRISLNTMTLQVESPTVYTCQGVPISVTGIAQVIRKSYFLFYIIYMIYACIHVDIYTYIYIYVLYMLCICYFIYT